MRPWFWRCHPYGPTSVDALTQKHRVSFWALGCTGVPWGCTARSLCRCLSVVLPPGTRVVTIHQPGCSWDGSEQTLSWKSVVCMPVSEWASVVGFPTPIQCLELFAKSLGPLLVVVGCGAGVERKTKNLEPDLLIFSNPFFSFLNGSRGGESVLKIMCISNFLHGQKNSSLFFFQWKIMLQFEKHWSIQLMLFSKRAPKRPCNLPKIAILFVSVCPQKF